MGLEFPAESFDVVICNHVYEHVPDSYRLLAEIHRVLRHKGTCYFSAGNRYKLVEGHYQLPLLSVVPKSLAHLYLRILGKGSHYYETHLTLWELQRLVAAFQVVDYTRAIISDPEKYHATDMLTSGSLKQNVALLIARTAYWLCPTYIWLLCKT